MSFLRRLKERRGKGSQNGTPAPALPEAEEVWGDEGRKGPLADFVATNERNEGAVDLGQANGSWSQSRQRSRLSKTIREVLHDHSALGYLIQYLEARDAAQLVRFWLDVESFRCSASMVITSSWAPPRVSRERLDRVPESPESESNYDDVEEEACQEPHGPGRTPCNSSSMDSFDSGLDTRSETGPEFVSPSSTSSSLKSPASLSSPPPCEGQEAQGRAEQLLQTRAEDAVKIYRRYIAPECQRPVHLDTEIKRRIVESICTEQGHVAADCFDEAQKVVVEMLETEYFPDFLTSQFHAKHQVDVLTSGQVLLADILYNDTALFHFMEFLEGHGQRVVMEFWLAAMNFSQANSRGATECQNDAMVLYDKFLSMQAPSPLGLPSNVRLQVEDAICRPGGPDSTCFQPVLSLVAAYLEANHFKPFLASVLYNNYVKELIAMIQASPRSLSSVQATLSTARTESDTRSSCSSSCSSDRLPRSTSNTLLAASSGLRASTSFDCGELQDPDSIWRRRPVKNKVGRVNSYGRYQPGLDLAPQMSRTEGTKKTSRLGRVVKNLVTNEEKEKMKEELAWQVAEMIVRDVTSVTMPEKEGEERRKSINGEELKSLREETLGLLSSKDSGLGSNLAAMRKSKSESFNLKELSMELPTAKYF